MVLVRGSIRLVSCVAGRCFLVCIVVKIDLLLVWVVGIDLGFVCGLETTCFFGGIEIDLISV